MKTVEQMAREATATGVCDELSGDSIHAYTVMVMEECAAMCDARLYNLRPGERPADAIRAAAKDLK